MSDPKTASYVEAVKLALYDFEYMKRIVGDDIHPFSALADWMNDYTRYLDAQRKPTPNTP